MEKSENMPIWVYFAFASIETRKSALLLVWASIVFSAYCVPWALLLVSHDWLAKIFLIEDWSWFAMMVPITFWYWISLRWIDNHRGWGDPGQDKSM